MIMKNEESIEKKALNKKRITTALLTAACLILGFIIAVQFKSLTETDKSNNQATTLSDYQAQIIALSDKVDLLESENRDLVEKISLIESGTNEEQIAKLESELSEIKRFAGLTRVVGEGVNITVKFADEEKIQTAAAAIQMLVNEIKASDAEAIAINGERLTAMSEVRVVNNYIVVNGKTYTQPIDISVIGRQSAINSTLEMPGGIVSILEKKYDAKITWEDVSEANIPAYAANN